jgi:hypothetical protein
MNAFGVALPLNRSSADGFVMIKSLKRLFRQNLKMLILTNPGERVMRPSFGVGIKSYLFESYQENVPAIQIIKILFEDTDPDRGRLSIAVVYAIPDINVKDLLQITI